MTQPPPSTPTPRRFLLSKRPPQSQRTPVSGPPVFASSQRFQTTPRFAQPSSTQRPSTQRPPSTPGFPSTARLPRHQDPIHDALDSSPLNSSPPDATATVIQSARSTLKASTQRVKERIEIDSDADSNSQDDDEEHISRPSRLVAKDSIEIESDAPGDTQGDTQSDLVERTPKRRRISITPTHSWENNAIDNDTAHLKEEDDVYHSTSEQNEMLLDDKDAILPDEDSRMSEEPDIPDFDETDVTKIQPTFQRAPRFKVSDIEAARQESLAVAFSPQRRGPKYVAGGLAAELQSWLADVKGWGDEHRPADLVMRIVIDEVRPGNRMCIVKGRRIVEAGEMREEIAARLMLAGEGRLTGLGQKASVVVGSSVAISQPAWEVVLQGTKWIVACDWAVL
nr:uncharacterized protein CTRU02_05079 [Colletotrichum truncatum]KAF6794878.1 hypothetical protein CTRU02_05079 [Colletotrichum truncatum]